MLTNKILMLSPVRPFNKKVIYQIRGKIVCGCIELKFVILFDCSKKMLATISIYICS